MVELSEEMEAKDAHMQGVLDRRREALTALDWSVVPDITHEDQEAATETAEYVQKELMGLRTWPETLEHNSTAIGPGLAVTELVWGEGHIRKTISVPGDRLENEYDGQGVRILTDENMSEGVPARPPKFVVHAPQARAGKLLRVTMTRALGYLFTLKQFMVHDMAGYAEVFGQPARVGHYDETVGDEERQVAEDFLKNLSSDMYALFPKGVTVELKEATKSTEPYTTIIKWVEEKQSILVLGQTLTTDVGSVGSLAAARVHENVRASISKSDMQQEARTLRDQVFRPMVSFRWPGQEMPVPIWQRDVGEEQDLEGDRMKLEKFRFMAERNLPVDPEVVYEELGIPQPKQKVEVTV